MAILPTQQHATDTQPAAARIVRCPGCGRRATLAADETAIESCACCTTRLISYGRRLDVEGSVRERLYGGASRCIEVATRRGR
jgi:ribosomal protein S27E